MSAKSVYKRSGSKAGGGKSKLPRDPGCHHVPGFLGRSKVGSFPARTGYAAHASKLGPGGRGRVITLPGSGS